MDFNSVTGGITAGNMGADDCGGGAMDSKGTSNSTEGSMWHYGMARRAKGDTRRTRVSFLLFWLLLIEILVGKSFQNFSYFYVFINGFKKANVLTFV